MFAEGTIRILTHGHFVQVENGIGNTQLLRSSWLYNSESAMALLQSLLQWREARNEGSPDS